MNWKFWQNIYRKRIARGVALLDEKVPNWRGHIDLEFFDISNSERCVANSTVRVYWVIVTVGVGVAPTYLR
jgi:hypothetical protein